VAEINQSKAEIPNQSAVAESNKDLEDSKNNIEEESKGDSSMTRADPNQNFLVWTLEECYDKIT